jgi:hypothetical protein
MGREVYPPKCQEGKSIVKAIEKYPCELISKNYSFDASASHREKISNQEIAFIIGNAHDFLKKILGKNFHKKSDIAKHPDFEKDSNQ